MEHIVVRPGEGPPLRIPLITLNWRCICVTLFSQQKESLVSNSVPTPLSLVWSAHKRFVYQPLFIFFLLLTHVSIGEKIEPALSGHTGSPRSLNAPPPARCSLEGTPDRLATGLDYNILQYSSLSLLWPELSGFLLWKSSSPNIKFITFTFTLPSLPKGAWLVLQYSDQMNKRFRPEPFKMDL